MAATGQEKEQYLGLEDPEKPVGEGKVMAALAGNISVVDSHLSSNISIEGDPMCHPSLIDATRLFVESWQGGNFDTVTQTLLIVAYTVLILFGVTGNGLVCYVVARNKHMRTPRNIFIINLAISDLTLCLFTQPFNLMKCSMASWKLADFMCKLLPMQAGTSVFVSTISITAIALDRFQVIVYPTKDSMKKVGAAIALISIWIISMLMASPLLIFNTVQHNEMCGMTWKLCIENKDLLYEKGAYSIASMVFQYICPIVIVSVAHARICNKLKYRMVNQQPINTANSPFQKRKTAREAKRKRKTNMLLIMIAVVFASSWIPLNVFNIIADFFPKYLGQIDKNNLVFPICHLLVLCSACTNPVLYGWLNENFRKEFLTVLCCSCCSKWTVLPCCRCCDYNPRRDMGNSSAVYSKANTNGATTAHMDTTDQPSTTMIALQPTYHNNHNFGIKANSTSNLTVP